MLEAPARKEGGNYAKNGGNGCSRDIAEVYAGRVRRQCRNTALLQQTTRSGRDRTKANRRCNACIAMVDCSKISSHNRCCVVNLRWPCSALGPGASGSCPWGLEKALVKHGTQIWAEGPVCGGAGICRVGRVGVWGCGPHSCRRVRIQFTT